MDLSRQMFLPDTIYSYHLVNKLPEVGLILILQECDPKMCLMILGPAYLRFTAALRLQL